MKDPITKQSNDWESSLWFYKNFDPSDKRQLRETTFSSTFVSLSLFVGGWHFFFFISHKLFTIGPPYGDVARDKRKILPELYNVLNSSLQIIVGNIIFNENGYFSYLCAIRMLSLKISIRDYNNFIIISNHTQ